MQSEGTLLLRRSDVEQLLSLRDCIEAVEEIFRLQGHGKVPAAAILGVKAPAGGLHVKAGLLPGQKDYIVAKLNTNFPNNRARSGLPTIQGVIVIYNAENGCPLAILDSIDITIKRTAAASAVAAKKLAAEFGNELEIEIEPVHDLPRAIQKSDICITCTTAFDFFVHRKDVSLGTFIAAVGADDAHKQEIDPALMASAKVVADSLEQ